MPVTITVTPSAPLVDEPLAIRLAGLEPAQRVTLRAHMVDDLGCAWESAAVYEADAAGAVEVASHPALAGTYTGVDAMGLVWSMEPQCAQAERNLFIKATLSPLLLTLSAEAEGETLASAAVECACVAAGVTTRPVRERGLVGTFFAPPGPGPHPAVMVMGGSGGGLFWSEPTAALLASRGYAALALAYFALGDLPPDLREIPLEYFETGLAWLAGQQVVDGERLAVMGVSKGGELVLLLAATFPQIRAVVGYVPSHVVWGGYEDGRAVNVASWTYRGEPLAFMPNRLTAAEEKQLLGDEPMAETPWFLANLENEAAAATAAIPVENSRAAYLLVSGEDDGLWPCTRMAAAAVARLAASDYPQPYEHLSYPGAGHLAGGPPYRPTTVREVLLPDFGALRLFAMGGSARDEAAAQSHSWPRVLAFLGEQFEA